MFCKGFFLTPPAEKTKTQGQNSSKKLKQKTQPLGGLSLPYAKLKKKLTLMKFSPQNSKIIIKNNKNNNSMILSKF